MAQTPTHELRHVLRTACPRDEDREPDAPKVLAPGTIIASVTLAGGRLWWRVMFLPESEVELPHGSNDLFALTDQAIFRNTCLVYDEHYHRLHGAYRTF